MWWLHDGHQSKLSTKMEEMVRVGEGLRHKEAREHLPTCMQIE